MTLNKLLQAVIADTDINETMSLGKLFQAVTAIDEAMSLGKNCSKLSLLTQL